MHQWYRKYHKESEWHGDVRMYLQGSVLFRKFGKDSGRETLQLVLPKKFRGTVLAVAHDWIMSEHQGGKKYS